jgi:hypothetical protein
LNYISGLPLKRGGKIGEGEGKSRKGSGRIRVKRNARELSVKVGRGEERRWKGKWKRKGT